MSLTDRAEAAAAAAQKPYDPPPPGPDPTEQLPDLSHWIPREDEGWDQVPVHIAWMRVRASVGSIAKDDDYKENGVRKYQFRGIEAALQAFGPATLRHGVNVLAVGMVAAYRDTKSKGGSLMRECTVTVTWQIMGPLGDSLPLLQSAGESLDTGDKGTAKAQSLALRALLINTGLIPTGAVEPEAAHVERGEAPTRTAESYRDEITNPDTSPARLEQIGYELRSAQMLHVIVTNETGGEETLDALGLRIFKERTKAPGTGTDQ